MTLPCKTICIVFFYLLLTPVWARAQDEASLETGKTLYTTGRWTEAETAFREAVVRQPRSALTHYWLGLSLYAQERDKEALKHFQQAIKHDAKRAEGYLGVGLVYLRTPKRRINAREAIQTATRLDPDNASIQYTLALTYLDRSQLSVTRDYGMFIDGQKYL
ncbi:MAG: tetratricopeptide repeat protein [candidate division Zixibacteria bacterium]|nr:tetratricopeptide repeat protein [candidate division Zixibacteria bacterium]